jgi:hypothetical protein
MENITSIVDADISTSGDVTITGILNGNIEVNSSNTLAITGIVNGNVTIHTSATVLITGILNGSIFNQGICEIIGTIHGELVENGGKFIIAKDAVIEQ